MRRKLSSILLILVGISYILVLQGCDQIRKLTDHISGKKPEISQNSQAPAPVSVKPIEDPSAQATETIKTPQAQVPAQAEPPKSQSENLAPNVLVKVGDWSMTIDEFRTQEKAAQDLAKQNKLIYDLPQERLLGMIIEQQLLWQSAQREGLQNDSKVGKQLSEARKLILAQSMQTKIVEGIKVGDEEIKSYYDKNKDQFVEAPAYKFSAIVVDSEEDANAIFSQLAQGGNFDEIVSSKSKVKPSGEFMEESKISFDKLRDTLKALDAGKFSPVFKGPAGYYIVRLDDKKGGEQKSFDSVKDAIKAELSYKKYLAELQRLQSTFPFAYNSKLLEAK